MKPEGEAAMTTIIDILMRRPDSVDFREPLDWRGLGLRDYPKVIKKPMDLATVKLNIKGYRTMNDCADDIQLIWSNCKKYNGEGSEYYSLADRFSTLFYSWSSSTKRDSIRAGTRRKSAAATPTSPRRRARRCASPSTTSRPVWKSNSRRVRSESPRRSPRHRRDTCSMAWRFRFLTARRS